MLGRILTEVLRNGIDDILLDSIKMIRRQLMLV